MMALEDSDMPATVEYLKAKGIEIVWGPRTRDKQYVRADPNPAAGFLLWSRGGVGMTLESSRRRP
jgi:hypothetical protein